MAEVRNFKLVRFVLSHWLQKRFDAVSVLEAERKRPAKGKKSEAEKCNFSSAYEKLPENDRHWLTYYTDLQYLSFKHALEITLIFSRTHSLSCFIFLSKHWLTDQNFAKTQPSSFQCHGQSMNNFTNVLWPRKSYCTSFRLPATFNALQPFYNG